MSRLLFRGTKTFWKTKSYLEVAIYEFIEQNVYEIIAYDPVLQKHAPRLHINIKATISVCSNEVTSQEQRERYLSMDSVVTTFLFNHIILTEYLPTSKLIKISLYKISSEDNVIIPRPLDLPFMVSPFAVFYGGGLESYPVGSVSHLQIPLREKWRIPLILVRVSKYLPLCEYDSKIWACFVHNKTQERLVESVAATLAARIPTVSRESLRFTAHSVLLPDNCPFPTFRAGSGTASPVLSRSGTSTRCNSRSSSRSPSPGPRDAAETQAPPCDSPPIAQAGASRLLSVSGESVPATPASRLSAKFGRPPLTPSSQKVLRTRSDGSAHSCPYQQESNKSILTAANISTTATTTDSIASGSISILTPPLKNKKTLPTEELAPPPIRKVSSFGNLWPVRMTRSAIVSLSAPSSPQASPRRVVPSMEEEVTWAGDEEEDDVFSGLNKHSTVDSSNKCSIKPSARQRMRQRNSLGARKGETFRPRGAVDNRLGGADRQKGVVVARRELPHSWGDGQGFSQWAAGLLQQQVRRNHRTIVAPMHPPKSPSTPNSGNDENKHV